MQSMEGMGGGSGLGNVNEKAGSNAEMLAKMVEKSKVDDEDFLSKEEFESIDFGFGEGDRFVIINDVLEKFTGIPHHP